MVCSVDKFANLEVETFAADIVQGWSQAMSTDLNRTIMGTSEKKGHRSTRSEVLISVGQHKGTVVSKGMSREERVHLNLYIIDSSH